MQPPFAATIALARFGMASTAVVTTRFGNFNAMDRSLALHASAVSGFVGADSRALEQDTIPVRAKKTLLAVVGWGVPRRRPPSPEVNVGPPSGVHE